MCLFVLLLGVARCDRGSAEDVELVAGIQARRGAWLERFPGDVLGIVGSGTNAILVDRVGDGEDSPYEMMLVSGKEVLQLGVNYGDTIMAGCVPVGIFKSDMVVWRGEMETIDYYLDGEVLWKRPKGRWRFSPKVPNGLKVVPVSLKGDMALYFPWMVLQDEEGPPQRLLVVGGEVEILEAGEVLVLTQGEARLAKVDLTPLLIIEMAGVWAYLFDGVVEFRDDEGRHLGQFREVLGVQARRMGTDGQRLFLTSRSRTSIPPVVIGQKDPLLTPIPLDHFQTWEEACAAVNVANGNVPYTLPFPSTGTGKP